MDGLQNDNIEIVKWIDPSIEDLKEELRLFSEQLSSLERERSDIEKKIHIFEVRHTKELGELILQILKIKKKLAKKNLKQRPNNTELREEFDQASSDETEFRNSYNETVKNVISELSPDQLKELKKKRDKIAKLTHPDKNRFDDKFKKEAEDLLVKTNVAYKNNDLKTITDILEYLENKKPFETDREMPEKKESLLAEIKYKQAAITKLDNEITATKNSEIYLTINEIDNWDNYFANSKISLNRELQYLESIL